MKSNAANQVVSDLQREIRDANWTHSNLLNELDAGVSPKRHADIVRQLENIEKFRRACRRRIKAMLNA